MNPSVPAQPKTAVNKPENVLASLTGRVYHQYHGTFYRVDLLTMTGDNRKQKKKNLKLIKKIVANDASFSDKGKRNARKYVGEQFDKYGIMWLMKKPNENNVVEAPQ